MEIEKNDFSFRGPPPPFSAHGRSRPGLQQRLPPAHPAFGLAQRRVRPAQRCTAPVPARRVPTTPGRDRRVMAMRRRRSPHGSHGLRPLPRARLHLPKPLRSPLHSPALPRCSARTRSALSPASATAAPPAESAVGAPPRPAIKRQQLRLALRHLVLAVVTSFEPR